MVRDGMSNGEPLCGPVISCSLENSAEGGRSQKVGISLAGLPAT